MTPRRKKTTTTTTAIEEDYTNQTVVVAGEVAAAENRCSRLVVPLRPILDLLESLVLSPCPSLQARSLQAAMV